jgi:hypothetical protein
MWRPCLRGGVGAADPLALGLAHGHVVSVCAAQAERLLASCDHWDVLDGLAPNTLGEL